MKGKVKVNNKSELKAKKSHVCFIKEFSEKLKISNVNGCQ
jgi:hypothetical protein